MLIVRRMFIVFLVVGIICSFLASAQIVPPDTGKMSWDLFRTVAAGQRRRIRGEEVQMVSALLITDAPVTEEKISALVERGYTVLGAFGQFILVEAPADHFADPENGVDVIDFVSNATLPPTTITNQTPITDGSTAIGAPYAWARGYQGEGVKIAVIDSGFDPDNLTLARFNFTLYLVRPTGEGVGTYEAVKGETALVSAHGTSCAIIAGDVAPAAKLYLLSFPPATGLIGWLAALKFAVQELGVDVVSTSVEFSRPTSHADGTGLLNEQVDAILSGTDAVLVISAGNWASGSGSDRSFFRAVFSDADEDYSHDFTSEADEACDRNTLQFSGRRGDWVIIVLEWDDWKADLGTQDLDLLLRTADRRITLAVSQTRQLGGTTDPVEIIFGQLPFTGAYALEIVNRAAKWYGQPVRTFSFHLNLFIRDGSFPFIEHHTTYGSVREVAANPAVITVGAVSVADGTVRPYSSRGPTPDGRSKPEVYAPDGVSGTAYPTFYGTSASAPYVAGAIALLYSAFPGLSKEELLDRLQGGREGEIDHCEKTILQKAADEFDDYGNPIYRLDLERSLQ